MNNRKVYRTVLTIEVLGNEPYTWGIDDLYYAITEGHFSGMTLKSETTELSEAEAAERLIAQGSDPDFLLGEDE